MDIKALFNLTYGLYAVTAADGDKPYGCIANTVVQLTSQNPMVSVCLNKENATTDVILKTGRLCSSVLSEGVSDKLIDALGYKSAHTAPGKFEAVNYNMFMGLPVVDDACNAHIIAEVVDTTDAETHVIIKARVLETITEVCPYPPMTYRFYYDVRKGRAPKNAPTYVAAEGAAAPQAPPADSAKPAETAAPPQRGDEATEIWVCTICGFEYEGDLMKEPDSWRCPRCKMDKSVYKKKQ